MWYKKKTTAWGEDADSNELIVYIHTVFLHQMHSDLKRHNHKLCVGK